jgi:hypothetical protein
MPDPAVAALTTDPTARVLVFIDGQNLYKTCRSLFGHPLCHPHLPAQHLAGPRACVDCRFYTGRPNPNTDLTGARNLDRRLVIMRREGVTVVTRPLRYHWDWGHPGRRLPAPGPGVGPQQVRLTPWMRPQEKGIDLVIGLDVVEFLLTRASDARCCRGPRGDQVSSWPSWSLRSDGCYAWIASQVHARSIAGTCQVHRAP